MMESSCPPDFAVADLSPPVLAKHEALVQWLLACPKPVIVAMSGGVDSTFLLKVTHDTIGEHAIALIGKSASLSAAEWKDAVALSQEIGANVRTVETEELDEPGYVQNSGERCYFCKSELFSRAEALGAEFGTATIVDGLNADDRTDVRPGRRAASERGVLHPLLEVGLTKAEIRALSRQLSLRTWNKPQLACLASRVPYGTEVTTERLFRIEHVESALRELGFFDVRARLVPNNDDMVRLELGARELARAVEPSVRERIVRAARDVGFQFVTMDLEGFRSGRMNETDSAQATLVALGRRDL